MENKISVCSLSGYHAQEGGSSYIHDFESAHGGNTQGTPLKCMRLGHWPDRNRGYEVVLLHDLQISPSQSPEGLGAGLVLGILPHIGVINFSPE